MSSDKTVGFNKVRFVMGWILCLSFLAKVANADLTGDEVLGNAMDISNNQLIFDEVATISDQTEFFGGSDGNFYQLDIDGGSPGMIEVRVNNPGNAPINTFDVVWFVADLNWVNSDGEPVTGSMITGIAPVAGNTLMITDTQVFGTDTIRIRSAPGQAIASGGHLFAKFNILGQYAPGDINHDGVVNLLDVGPMAVILATGGFEPEADINRDGTVNLLDIDPFIELLSN